MAEAVAIDVQPTPNVNAMKFVLNRTVSGGRSQTFRSPDDATSSPLAASLLAIPGVVQVFFLNDFITLTRDPGVEWAGIIAQAESTVRTYFDSAP